MDVSNAYAAPQAPIEIRRPVFGESDGKRVGLARAGTPPAVCAKCGTGEGVLLSRRLFASGRIGIVLVVGAAIWGALVHWWPAGPRLPLTPVALVTAFLLTLQWAGVTVPLCRRCAQRWRLGTAADSVALAAMCVAPFAFVYTASTASHTELLTQSFLYIAGVVILNAGARSFSRSWVLRAHDMDPSRVWVTGLHPDAEAAYCSDVREA